MKPTLSISAAFHHRALHLLCILPLMFAGSARAHDPYPPFGTPLVIPLGQERSYYLVADVLEDGPSRYEFVDNEDDFVASVESAFNFSEFFFGDWTIRGNEIGETLMVFNWEYKAFSEDEFILVEVVAPPASAANNSYFLDTNDPINTRSGEFHSEEALDLSLSGPMPLSFSRYYSSELVKEGFATSALGTNRLHNFDWKLTFEVPARSVRIVTDHGRVIYFERRTTGTAWTLAGRKDIPWQLVETAGILRLADPFTQRVYSFDANGKLIKIEDGRGNTHTLTYTGSTLTSVADGLGRTLTFVHGGGKLTTVTDHTGRQVSFTYSGNNLATATDTLGHVTTYSYTSNLLTSFMRPEANVPFTQVFTNGQVTSQTERTTDTTALLFNPGSTVVTNPLGHTMTHNYAPTGEIISFTDEGGRTTTFSSDATGRRTSITDRMGDKTGITYHTLSGKTASIINAEGKSTVMTYKARVLDGHTFHDLSKITYPDAASRSFIYDTKGNVTQITDELGKIWKFTYNIRGQVLTRTNPLGGVSTYIYEAAGNLASSQEPDTGITTYGYDAKHRLIQTTLPGGATVLLAYDNRDRITSITDERSKVSTFAYDDNDRLTGITDPDTQTSGYAYDALDRVTQVTDRLGAISGVSYNSRRLVESVTDRNNSTTTLQYDSRQRPISMTDAGAQVWPSGYDDEGLLLSSATPINPPTKIKRNKLGQPVEISNPLGHTARLARDVMQRVTQAFDPLGRQTTYAYDKRGLLISATEQGTGTGKYDRDGLGNITKITDPSGGIWTYTYLKSGRLATMTDPLGKKWTYSYDTRGRLQTTTFPDTTTSTMAYDAASNVTGRQHSGGGPNLIYSYDNLGRLDTADGLDFSYDAEGRVTNAEQNGFDFNATYDDGGRLLTVSYLDGAVVVTYEYDTRNRLTRVTDSVTTAQMDFTYDNAGRLTGMTRSNGVNGAFTYDAAGRLTRIQEGTLIDLQYALNPVGEVASVDFTAPVMAAVTAAAPQAFKLGKASQLTSTGYVYDARGRCTAAPGDTFAWDGAARLTNADGVLLAYNGLGDVITRTVGPEVTRFYHHYALGMTPIVYEDPQTGSDRAYVWTPGGRLLYSIDQATSQATFYHFDHIGSTLALTNEAGAVTDAYAYGTYGEPMPGRIGTSTQPFQYVGAYGVRAEGTLYHMRARYYDPVTAHFLSRDPLPARLTDLKSLNPYQYASQNPLHYVDPMGSLDRFAHGFEKTILDGNASVGLQLPLFSSEPSILNPGAFCKPLGSGHSPPFSFLNFSMPGALCGPPEGSGCGVRIFPFVTNAHGFDTGLAAQDTGADPFGTATTGQSIWYKWTAPPSSHGSFQGYVIATSNFQLAHGFAFVSDVGARNLAQGYLSLILPAGGPTGGGIHSGGPPITLPNSIISGNQATAAPSPSSPITLKNTTISGNTANPLPKGVNAFGAQFLEQPGTAPGDTLTLNGRLFVP